MSTDFLKRCCIFLGLRDEFAKEIEEYFRWKLNHRTEPTTDFARVRQNLHGDYPLPWTSVQIYLSFLIKDSSANKDDTRVKLAEIAFPPYTNLITKFAWFQNTSMFSFNSNQYPSV